MAPGTDPAFQQAMDKLLLQVDRDNVLAVGKTFQVQANNLQFELKKTEREATLGLCGLDPVSADVVKDSSIGGKVKQLLVVHWQHWEELTMVAAALEETARSYGHTEEHIHDAFPKAR